MIIQELDPALMIYKKRDNDPASGSGFSIPANGSRPNLTLELHRELDPDPEGTIYKKKIIRCSVTDPIQRSGAKTAYSIRLTVNHALITNQLGGSFL